MKNIVLSMAAAALVVGAGAFYGGMKYAQSAGAAGRNGTANDRQQRFQGATGANAGGTRLRPRFAGATPGEQGFGGQGGGGAVGEVIAKDDKSITLKLRDGGSKIIFLSTTTEVAKSAKGSPDDLQTGSQIFVNGTPNSDGSISAQMIQLRPATPVQ